VPRYLLIAGYTQTGVQGLLQGGGSARRTAIEKTVTGLGGQLLALDFAMDGDDVYVYTELPDPTAAAAVALAVRASGAVAAVRVVSLLAPEDVDEATRLRPDYSPPARS
jgi:uncharacterized protein with GYD domain